MLLLAAVVLLLEVIVPVKQDGLGYIAEASGAPAKGGNGPLVLVGGRYGLGRRVYDTAAVAVEAEQAADGRDELGWQAEYTRVGLAAIASPD